MKVTCPKNKKHKKFYVTAHVTEDWFVDNKGNWERTVPGGETIVHAPDSQDLYTCAECGEAAEVRD